MTYPPQPGPYGDSGGYGQPYPGQPRAGQHPGQHHPGQRYPGYPGTPPTNQRYPGYPGYPEQQRAGQPYPGAPEYRGQFPNQPYQGHSHQRPSYGTPPGDVPPPPPPEPPKRTPATPIVGVALGVLLLAGIAIGITGFWQPGFFLDNDVDQDSSLAAEAAPGDSAQPSSTVQRPQNAAPTPTSRTTPAPANSDDTEIRRITDTVVAGINNRDAATVKPIACDPSNERQADYDGFPDDLTASVSGAPRVEGHTASVPLTLRRSDADRTVTLRLNRANGAWCASGIKSS